MDTKLIQVWFHSQRERRTTKARQDPPRQGSNYFLSLHGCEPKSAARKNEKCLKNLQLDITHWVLRILCNHCSMWYKKLVGVWICPFFPLSTTKVSGQAITRTKRPNKKTVQTKFTYVHLQCNSLQSQRNNKTCMYPSSCWTCCFSCCDRSRPKDGFALALDTWCSFYSLHRWVTQSSNTFILAVLSWGKVGGKTEDRNWNHKSPHLQTWQAQMSGCLRSRNAHSLDSRNFGNCNPLLQTMLQVWIWMSKPLTLLLNSLSRLPDPVQQQYRHMRNSDYFRDFIWCNFASPQQLTFEVGARAAMLRLPECLVSSLYWQGSTEALARGFVPAGWITPVRQHPNMFRCLCPILSMRLKSRAYHCVARPHRSHATPVPSPAPQSPVQGQDKNSMLHNFSAHTTWARTKPSSAKFRRA